MPHAQCNVLSPAWLYAKYPHIAAVGPNGIRYRFGSRRDYNLSNPHFIEATRQTVTALAEHYRNNRAVTGFQIDNELGSPYSYDHYTALLPSRTGAAKNTRC